MDEILTNKLSIRLIRESTDDIDSILKDPKKLTVHQISNNIDFYFTKPKSSTPKWVKNFFNDTLDGLKFFNSVSNGLLLVKIKINKEKKIFAISFGGGWQFLKLGICEERFGLKVVLNSIAEEGFRKIEKKSMESVPKDSSEQLSKTGEVSDFGINIEQDLITSITALSKVEKFGNMLTGKEALTLSTKVDISNIKDLLNTCYQQFSSNDYKKNFGWIDHIAEVRDPEIINDLNSQLIERINKRNFDQLWMAVPEIIDWASISGFKYSKTKKANEYEDIHLTDFLNEISSNLNFEIDLPLLKEREVFCFSSDQVVKSHWTAFHCIYFEISETDRTFLLSNGKWYQIEQNFVKEINNDFKNIQPSSISFPDYIHSNEEEYNKFCAQQNTDLICMDKDLIYHGGGRSKLEFCDLMSKQKQLIHIKHYGGSSLLSHLFFQGFVSAELLIGDSDFRKKVNKKLPDSHKLTNPEERPEPNAFEIVYAIISSKPNQFTLPFFSKISIRNVTKRLLTYGFKVSLNVITNKSESKI